MNTRSRMIGLLAAGCAAGLFAPHAVLAVTDDEFNALKDLVTKQGQRLDELEQKHLQDQKIHEQDQQKIQDLQRQLGETQATATNAMQKAEAATQAQARPPIKRPVIVRQHEARRSLVASFIKGIMLLEAQNAR